MGFFGDAFANIRENFAERDRVKKEEQRMMRDLELQARVERQRVFKEEYEKNIRMVLIAKAKKEAAELSGLQKMRAENRVRNLENPKSAPDSKLGRLSAYMQRNMAKREENLKKTAEARKNVPTTAPTRQRGKWY